MSTRTARFPVPSARGRRIVPGLAVLALTGVLLAGCGEDTTDGSADDPASTPAAGAESSTATGESSSATEEPSTSATEGGPETTPASIYFVGDTAAGEGLFREETVVPADNPLEEAASLMIAGDTLDPDYRSAWPEGSFSSVTFDGDAFVVDLSDETWLDAVGSAEESRLAVQQLVYTLQATEGSEAPVRVQLDGEPADTLLGVEVGDGLTAEPELDVLALVNVITPSDGAPVTGTFTATGEASSFEATVPWEVRDASGKAVLDGFTTAEGWIDGLYPWEAEVDVSSLDPGEYTFVAMTDDPSGGAEGNGPTEDTKMIVVE